MKLGKCQWFKHCPHPATDTITHPKYGDVPICEGCRECTRFRRTTEELMAMAQKS